MFQKRFNWVLILIVMLVVLLPAFPVMAQEATPEAVPPDAPPTVVVEEQSTTLQNILLGAVALGLLVVAAALYFGLNQMTKHSELLYNQALTRYQRADAALVPLGQTYVGQSIHAGLMGLVEAVDDPDDKFVQGLTETLINLQLVETLQKRYPTLDRKILAKTVSKYGTAVLRAAADLFDGKPPEVPGPIE